MRKMRALGQFILFGVLLGFCISVHAQDTGQESTDTVQTNLLSSIQTRSSIESLFILNLGTQSDDSLPWGSYCARLLVAKIGYAPNEIVYIPSLTSLFRDLSYRGYENPNTLLLALDTTKYYAKAYGTKNLLQGNVIKKGNNISIHVSIFNLEQDKMIADVEESGSMKDPADLFNRLALKILNALNVKLSDENNSYLSLKNTGNADAFRIGMDAFALSDTNVVKSEDLFGESVDKDNDFLMGYIFESNRLASMNSPRRMEVLQEGCEHFKDHVYMKFAYMIALSESANYVSSIQAAQEILAKNPECLLAMQYEGVDYSNISNYPKGLDVLRKATRMYPDTWQSHYNYGLIAGAYANAARGGRFYMQMNSDEQYIFNKYNDIGLIEMQKAGNHHPDHLLIIGKLLNRYNEGPLDDTDITELFTRSTALNPHYIDSYNSMIWHYRPGYSNQPKKLRDLMRQAILLNPGSQSFAWMVFDNVRWYEKVEASKSEAYIFEQDTETLNFAKESLRKVYQGQTTNHLLGWQDAEMFYSLKEWKEAWHYYNQLPDSLNIPNFNVHEYFLHKARAAGGADLDDKAMEYADKCLSVKPCNVCGPQALELKGVIWIDQKKYEEGFNSIQLAIDWNPKLPGLKREYGIQAVKANKHIDQAEKYVLQAMEIDPEYAKWYEVLAQIYQIKKDKENALKNIDKAIDKDPYNETYIKLKQTILESN